MMLATEKFQMHQMNTKEKLEVLWMKKILPNRVQLKSGSWQYKGQQLAKRLKTAMALKMIWKIHSSWKFCRVYAKHLSGVATKHFGSTVTASSTHVENYFKHLKKYMEHSIPGRADEIVAEHIEIIDGILIDASQKYIEFVDAAGGKSNFIGYTADDGVEKENQDDSNGDEHAIAEGDEEHSDEYNSDENEVRQHSIFLLN